MEIFLASLINRDAKLAWGAVAQILRSLTHTLHLTARVKNDYT